MPVEGCDQRFRRLTLRRIVAIEIFPGEIISGSAGSDQFFDDLPPRGIHVVRTPPLLDPRDDAVDLAELADVGQRRGATGLDLGIEGLVVVLVLILEGLNLDVDLVGGRLVACARVVLSFC